MKNSHTMKYQKILLTILILLFSLTTINSQTFKEIIEFHENGQQKVEHIKNIDLKLIRINIFDINGNLIEFTNYDPKTSNKNGKFMEGSNKGYYNQNKLNCNNCNLITSNSYRSKIKFNGSFKDGKPIGKIKVYSLEEKTSLQRDPLTSYLLSLELNKRINYSTYVGTGVFNEEFLYEINYDENGKIYGRVNISETSSLVFENGMINEIYNLNEENKSIYRDSVGIDFKIWKINNRYYRNNGWLNSLSWNEFNGDKSVKISASDVMDGSTLNVFFGNENTKYVDGAPLVAFRSFGYNKLNKKGIYEKSKDIKIGTSYIGDVNLTDLFFEVPISLFDTFTPFTANSDVSVHFNLKSFIKNCQKDNVNNQIIEALQKLQKAINIPKNKEEKYSFSTFEYYKILQELIDSQNSPITEVYLVDRNDALYSKEKPSYNTFKNHHKPFVLKVEKRIAEEIRRKEEEKKRIIKEKERIVAEKLRLAERIKEAELEIKNANVNSIISGYFEFIGGEEKVKRENKISYKKEWNSSVSGKRFNQTIYFIPNQYYYTKISFDGNNQEILADLNKEKGEYRLNGKRKSKLDKNYINSLQLSAALFPELVSDQFTYHGTKEISFGQKSEKCYHLKNGTKNYYYSILDYRKVREVENSRGQMTITDFYDYNGENLLIPNRMIIKNGTESSEYILKNFESITSLPKEIKF